MYQSSLDQIVGPSYSSGYVSSGSFGGTSYQIGGVGDYQVSLDDQVEYLSGSLPTVEITSPSAVYGPALHQAIHRYLQPNLSDEVYRQPEKRYYSLGPMFLNPYRVPTKFTEDAEDIQELICETFEKTVGKTLPDDIVISVCNASKLKEVFPAWTESVLGFAMHTLPKQVFVRQGELAMVMITMGHEIGHVVTPRLEDTRDEEAKAFAFSLAWNAAIREHNIGELKNSLLPQNPAENGIHNVAFQWILKRVEEGKNPLELYYEIASGQVLLSRDLKQ